jgi:hypothetical protein
MANVITALADGTYAVQNTADNVNDSHLGGPASPSVANPRFMMKRVMKVPLGVVDTGGGVLSWVNPHSFAIIIHRVTLDVTTKSTGASTIDVGTTAVSATTSSDNLIDGQDTGTAIGTFDNITEKGTNGKSRQKLAVGAWVTASKATGACAGLVGNAYIEYYPL